ncbi:MAG: phosphatidate cytidylyltransferase [Pirellulales bacterium]|nr:phosphatidate cytidylyltransferase [Pirellulales bacterium]
MLRWRLALGTTFVATLAALCWLDARAETPGTWLMPLALVLAVLGTQELLGMWSDRPQRPLGPAVYLGNIAIVLANLGTIWRPVMFGPLGWPAIGLALATILVFWGEMARYTRPGGVAERLGLAALALTYIGLMISFLVQLRLLGPGGSWGLAALASLVLIVKTSDIGAYTVGRLFGRHKMAPVLSPGKTLEGAAGALAAALLAAWVSQAWLIPAIVTAGDEAATAPGDSSSAASVVPDWGWIVAGLSLCVVGIVGDLAESLLKRDAGRKDSSNWMPGFGGVLDLIDSLLLTAPVAYLLWSADLMGPR